MLLTNLAVIVAIMLVLWIVGTVRRDASIVDSFWGTAFVIVAWLSVALGSPASDWIFLLACLVTVWGLRLTFYIAWRNWGAGEDHRYAAMRAHHGTRWWWISLGSVFMLQAALLWFISLPIQAAALEHPSVASPVPLGAGLLLWGVGFVFETAGDWQLARFRANPNNAGRVLDRGLWGYTRHPNYFGDFCVWWGFYFIASALGAAWTVASPLLMSALLMKVSGVNLLERTIEDRRPGYREYQASVNAFFPGPPKRFSDRN